MPWLEEKSFWEGPDNSGVLGFPSSTRAVLGDTPDELPGSAPGPEKSGLPEEFEFDRNLDGVFEPNDLKNSMLGSSEGDRKETL